MILKLSKEELYTTEIARQLTAEGFHSPTSDRVLTSTVRTIRKKHGILQNSKSRPVHVAGYLTTAQLEKKLASDADGFRRRFFRVRLRSRRMPADTAIFFRTRNAPSTKSSSFTREKSKSTLTGGHQDESICNDRKSAPFSIISVAAV